MYQRSRAHWVRGLGLLSRESSLDSISISSSPSAPLFKPMVDNGVQRPLLTDFWLENHVVNGS